MTMNKQKGNMYGFVTHTWNPIKGRCSHGCSYCYMIPFWKSEVHLDEKEFKTDLGNSNIIFIGSSTDLFAENVPEEWISKTLEHCNKYPKNTYLFQTKNPKRFEEFCKEYPNTKDTIFGTTIETNRENNLNNAPPRSFRLVGMLSKFIIFNRSMITIEPIMDFDLEIFIKWIKDIRPEFVNIGADSKGHNLPEPSSEKIGHLISELRMFTKVNLKDNLKRIYKE